MKADDSSLDPEDLRMVEERARRLLDRAAAWERLPTPIDDILAAASLKVAPTSAFNPQAIVAYLKSAGHDAGRWLKSAVSKILGVYDSADHVIHIDDSVVSSKQSFLKLHETGHHELPTHRKMFRFFQDCEKTLAPEIADQFEREANNFARFAIFQGDLFTRMAADSKFEIKTPMKLAPKFGASVYASVREFARTNHRACVVYVLEPATLANGSGVQALVRRIEPSPEFERQFGRPSDRVISLDHVLGPALPIGRKMTRPMSIPMTDLNGVRHDCVAEAFDTTYNILILVYPVKALSSARIIVPPGFSARTAGGVAGT